MLVLNDVVFEFGSREILSEANWHIKPGEKIGLIGPNGTGKSTLLRIIAGEYRLSSGSITGRKGLSIGFLNQDLLSYQSTDSILHVAMEAFEKVNKLNDQIQEVLNRLETDHSEQVLHKLHDLQVEFDALDGYNIRYKAEQVLEGLGFSTNDLNRPLKEFSGGWRMRVMLGKILLQQPDLLLLDEPTNHLDLPSIKWIEEYLVDYPGTVIVVSHDRYFLDRVVNRIAELANAQITVFKGNYENYLEEKALRDELQRNQFKNQEKYIKEQEKLIDRFRAKASKAKMAQSRIKALEKLDRIEDVSSDQASINIRFNFSQPSGKIVTELKIREKSYGSQLIFTNTEAQILRQDKIALIGANGKGKSTLLRMIAGVEPFVGERIMGYNVLTTYFAQHQLESLGLENTLLEELQHFAPEESDTSLRTLLGAFLFTGDDVFKKIKVLSGGEKSRVALAKAILSKANFLILDEPTNHLDMLSVNILIEVLKAYEGSFVVVSHDRYFLSNIANKIWYIENGELKEYPGTYEEYEVWRAQNLPQTIKKVEVKETIPEKKKTVSIPQKEPNKKAQAEFKKVEAEIELASKEKLEIEKSLSDPKDLSEEQMKDLISNYEKIQLTIKDLEKRWEELFLQISDE